MSRETSIEISPGYRSPSKKCSFFQSSTTSMALLWQLQHDQWQPVPMAGSLIALSTSGELRKVLPSAIAPIRLRAAGSEWVLLADPGARARINGEPLALGIRVLRDRDEIVLGGARSYFSTECLACVEPFPGAEVAVVCARCRQKIEPRSAAVRCPGCATWCHQTEDLPCWEYAPTCPLCSASTALDAGYRWEPES